MTQDFLEIVKKQMEEEARFETPTELAKFINPSTVTTPALKKVEEFYMKAVTTPNFRGIINLPPQEGKSTLISQICSAWSIYHNRSLKIFMASYGQEPAELNGESVKTNLVKMGVKISRTSASKTDFELKDNSGRVYSTHVGGGTGRPADLVILDDLLKGEAEASSVLERERVYNWYISTIVPRLGNGAPVIIVMTRWHEEDICGKLMERDGTVENGGLWNVLNIPAEATEDDDILGREKGQFLISARGRTAADWTQRKKEVGTKTWEQMFQGNPTPAGGSVFDARWVKYYNAKYTPLDSEGVWLQSWDLSFSGKKTSDYTVGQIWCKVGSDFFLVDEVKGKWNLPQAITQFNLLSEQYPQAYTKLVEAKANGQGLIDTMKEKGVTGLIPISPTKDKISRAEDVTPFFEAENILFPRKSFTEELVNEVIGFPYAKNDDSVDAMTQAINYLVSKARKKKKSWVTYSV